MRNFPVASGAWPAGSFFDTLPSSDNLLRDSAAPEGRIGLWNRVLPVCVEATAAPKPCTMDRGLYENVLKYVDRYYSA